MEAQFQAHLNCPYLWSWRLAHSWATSVHMKYIFFPPRISAARAREEQSNSPTRGRQQADDDNAKQPLFASAMTRSHKPRTRPMHRRMRPRARAEGPTLTSTRAHGVVAVVTPPQLHGWAVGRLRSSWLKLAARRHHSRRWST